MTARLVLAAALFVLAIAAGCGGGSGAGPSAGGKIPPMPTELRSDLAFGYYGGCASNMLEQAGHASLWWATGWCNGTGTWFLDMAAEATSARAAGYKQIALMLPPAMVWGDQAPAEARFQFEHLVATHTLDGWATILLYPQDEPDFHGYTDADLRQALANLRAAAAGLAPLDRAKFAVIYACRTGQTPAASAFDWIGCDDYDSGCAVLSGWYARMELAPAQRAIVVPGGADPWRQDPACFLDYAERTPSVAAIVPFIWQTADGHRGIRENATRSLYCQAGHTATRPAEAPADTC